MELWKEADEEKDQLFATMEQVRTKLAKKAKVEKEALNLRCCKWEQVMQEVQTTATDWKTSAKNSKTMLCIDKVGRNSDVFSSWLELLPSGDYSSRYVLTCRSTHFTGRFTQYIVSVVFSRSLSRYANTDLTIPFSYSSS